MDLVQEDDVDLVNKAVKEEDRGVIASVWILKCGVTVIPASILPRLWTTHPHIAFGIGLILGLTLQHFIPPRGKWVHLFLLIFAAVVVALIEARL